MDKVFGNIVDLQVGQVYFGCLSVESGVLVGKEKVSEVRLGERFVLPGLVDSHVHIESSMLVPGEFAKLALRNGVVSVVADPHEIANVCGVAGVKYMFDQSRIDWFKFYFGVPSCVPATPFETSGAVLGVSEVKDLLVDDKVVALAEVMNFPGVINAQEDVIGKIEAAKRLRKVVDGHAPGLSGDNVVKYAEAGVNTDHECMGVGEAVEKIRRGMMIQIREGSAARNFDSLIPLLKDYRDKIMFCNDDAHPDDLLEGYMNKRLARGVQLGYDVFDLLHAMVVNPVELYKLDVGLMREGDKADFCVVDNLTDFNVSQTYVNGKLVYDGGVVGCDSVSEVINKFELKSYDKTAFKIQLKDKVRVIDVEDGELYTKEFDVSIDGFDEESYNTEADILKMVVLNRYEDNVKPAVGYIRGFGIKNMAIASTVAHDSHNIVAVATSDELLRKAVDKIIEMKGGIVACDCDKMESLQLEIAGLMTRGSGEEVAAKYKKLNSFVKERGGKLQAPFMTLAFMSLLVIPELKLSDKGLFDGEEFKFTDVTF